MRLSAFISLFAMALIYTAPLLSQLNHASMDHASMMHSGMEHNTHAPSKLDKLAVDQQSTISPERFSEQETTNTAPHHANNNSHLLTADHFGLEAACGYCTLLFHLNWLNAFSFELPVIPPPSYHVINTPIVGITLATIYSDRQPRAPPHPASPLTKYKKTTAST
ncbi:DUF2946 family protein [Marinomonas pollencensis]|uniref:DUF2946 family protein n=2 Tax=Marinomonas pollencensis TaxID=491954 RepID=A0A3E0DKN1_9GAMM|nr:DUF2946 family protein [Marinomonas pollencensis]